MVCKRSVSSVAAYRREEWKLPWRKLGSNGSRPPTSWLLLIWMLQAGPDTWCGSVPRPFPKTLGQLQGDFAREKACEQYLAACRWFDGFICPRCRQRRAYELANRWRRHCAGCRQQVSRPPRWFDLKPL